MKLAAILITACVVLAAAQAALSVLAVLLMCGLVYGLFVCPRELLGLLGLCLTVGLIQRYPLACMGFAALMLTGRILRSR